MALQFKGESNLRDLLDSHAESSKAMREAQHEVYNAKFKLVDFAVQNQLLDCLTININRLRRLA